MEQSSEDLILLDLLPPLGHRTLQGIHCTLSVVALQFKMTALEHGNRELEQSRSVGQLSLTDAVGFPKLPEKRRSENLQRLAFVLFFVLFSQEMQLVAKLLHLLVG